MRQVMSNHFFYHPDWPILHEDNHLLALYKPAGLLVQGDQTGQPSLLDLGKAWLKERYNKPGEVFLGLVHRLDRPVAGVLIFCRTSKAARRVSEQFRLGKVAKYYLAILEGKLKADSGRLIHQVERHDDRSSRIVTKRTSTSQEARLSYQLLDTIGTKSLVQINLETGRHHQIRLQMAHIGHPVLGDLRYGASAPLPQKQIALFARRLTVTHPTRNDVLVVESPLPREWPWPDLEIYPQAPPWNWCELYALICSSKS
jgi:23S rRNA pseudouridine1911/1915/1917 synthase